MISVFKVAVRHADAIVYGQALHYDTVRVFILISACCGPILFNFDLLGSLFYPLHHQVALGPDMIHKFTQVPLPATFNAPVVVDVRPQPHCDFTGTGHDYHPSPRSVSAPEPLQFGQNTIGVCDPEASRCATCVLETIRARRIVQANDRHREPQVIGPPIKELLW